MTPVSHQLRTHELTTNNKQMNTRRACRRPPWQNANEPEIRNHAPTMIMSRVNWRQCDQSGGREGGRQLRDPELRGPEKHDQERADTEVNKTPNVSMIISVSFARRTTLPRVFFYDYFPFW